MKSFGKQTKKAGKICLSVVTVYKENLGDLISTAGSLSGLEFEWIVVHGGQVSHKNLLKSLGFSSFVYIDGPDSGIYHGMNKGLSAATGEYVWFLNAGDLALISDSDSFLSRICRFPKIDLWLFGQFNLDSRKFAKRAFSPTRAIKWGIRPLPHQAIIFSRRKLLELGGYKTNIGMIADQELILRALYTGKYRKELGDICAFKGGGIGSNQTTSFESQMSEINKRIPQRLITLLRHLKLALRNI